MIDLNRITEEEKTPLVSELLHIIQQQHDDIQRLRDEIARLKNLKGKPKIPQANWNRKR